MFTESSDRDRSHRSGHVLLGFRGRLWISPRATSVSAIGAHAPWNVWAFRHVSELIPTARIAATPGLVEEPSVSADGLIRQDVSIDGETITVADILRKTSTDALVVMKSGRIVADFHAPNFTCRPAHPVFRQQIGDRDRRRHPAG